MVLLASGREHGFVLHYWLLNCVQPWDLNETETLDKAKFLI